MGKLGWTIIAAIAIFAGIWFTNRREKRREEEKAKMLEMAEKYKKKHHLD